MSSTLPASVQRPLKAVLGVLDGEAQGGQAVAYGVAGGEVAVALGVEADVQQQVYSAAEGREGIFAIMYFFMIRPQQKKQKEIRNFQNSLQEGSKVVTGGGIYGTIKKVDIATGKIELEIAKGVVITVDKGSVFADVAASATVSKEK